MTSSRTSGRSRQDPLEDRDDAAARVSRGMSLAGRVELDRLEGDDELLDEPLDDRGRLSEPRCGREPRSPPVRPRRRALSWRPPRIIRAVPCGLRCYHRRHGRLRSPRRSCSPRPRPAGAGCSRGSACPFDVAAVDTPEDLTAAGRDPAALARSSSPPRRRVAARAAGLAAARWCWPSTRSSCSTARCSASRPTCEDAWRMLRALSGRTHQVVTGVRAPVPPGERRAAHVRGDAPTCDARADRRRRSRRGWRTASSGLRRRVQHRGPGRRGRPTTSATRTSPACRSATCTRRSRRGALGACPTGSTSPVRGVRRGARARRCGSAAVPRGDAGQR